MSLIADVGYANRSDNLESGEEGVEGEEEMTRRSILNLSVVTVFGHILTYSAFKLSLYVDDMLLYISDPSPCTNEIISVLHTYGQISVYRLY